MSISFAPGSVGIANPLSQISRLPAGTLNPGGSARPLARPEEDRQTELLRKFSANARRLRGGNAPLNFDLTKLGRRDALEAMVLRGIIPILVTQPSPLVTLHAAVQCEPTKRAGPETITATPGGAFVSGGPAVDTTFGATGVQDLTAVSSVDSNAVGKARVTIS